MRFSVFFLTLVFSFPLWGQSHPDLGNFEDYPVESKIWLATMAGEAVVNPEFPVLATELSTVEWLVADGAEVKEDEILGYRGADNIELTKRELELKKSRYANSLSDLEWTNRDKRKSLKSSIAELEGNIDSMEMTPKERELLGVDFEERLKKELEELGKQLDLMKSRLAGEYFDQELKDAKTELNLDLDKAQQDYDDLVKAAEIRSPSDGRVEIITSKPYKVEKEIAKVRMNGRGELHLGAQIQAFGNIPPGELVIELQGEDGKIYKGEYLRSQGEKLFEQQMAGIVFTLEGEDENLPEGVAGRRMCRIFRKLDEPGRLVPKEKLLFEHPKEILKGGWAAFVKKRWPGTKLVLIGPRDLVIRREGGDED